MVKDNIFSRAAGYGLQDRPGGIGHGKSLYRRPHRHDLRPRQWRKTTPGGVSGTVSGNVFIGGANIGRLHEGFGLQIGNVKPGGNTLISNNIFTHGIDKAGPAIHFLYGIGAIQSRGFSGH